jgi:hypothetical protein
MYKAVAGRKIDGDSGVQRRRFRSEEKTIRSEEMANCSENLCTSTVCV